MIRVRNLHQSYRTRFGTNPVLQGIDFDLAMGERLGILGRNGAGKSTMVRLISGAERPSAGSIESDLSISWPLAFGGAFQLQLTGIDNIRFISRIYEQDFEKNLEFVEQFAELGPYLREPVRSYSSGMRARLAFAISMIIEFDCFLIDEIGAVGDARFHDRCNYELFDKRSDRAMIIISHDAGYLRDHCNHWAILHEGKLAQYDDFEVAYTEFKQLIGADTRARPAPVDFGSRSRMIDSSQRSALTDERFRALVQQGDWARDEREWAKAEGFYSEGLRLYPYQRSYWTQLGHVAKEQERFTLAEIAYRTAVALGEPLADVEEHARFVIARQGDEDTAPPVRLPGRGGPQDQPPGAPDIEVFHWLADGVGSLPEEAALARIRRHDTLDSLAAGLFEANEPPGFEQAETPVERSDRLQILNAIFGHPLDEDALDRIAQMDDARAEVVERFLSAGMFDQWPQTIAAITTHANPAAKSESPRNQSTRIH